MKKQMYSTSMKENNKEKFLKLVSDRSTTTLANIKYRADNKDKIRAWQGIAIKVLLRMDELELTKKDLALLTKVSERKITKVVGGQEDTPKELLKELETVLNIKLV